MVDFIFLVVLVKKEKYLDLQYHYFRAEKLV